MFNVSHSKKISGRVKTLSRNIMHSSNSYLIVQLPLRTVHIVFFRLC